MKKYLSTKEVAELLGVTARTVGVWANKGLIGHMRAGRVKRYTMEHVKEFEQKNTTKAHE